MSYLSNTTKLIIQPDGEDTSRCLASLGFETIPAVPQLLYRGVTKSQIEHIFLQLSKKLSETSQTCSRFIVTHLPIDSNQLLFEFLQAQPLRTLTYCLRHAWFFRLLLQPGLFFKYQPIFKLVSGEIYAYECLARGQGDRGQCLSGGQLIEAAISTHLTREFDELARTTCIESIAAFNTHQTFFINVLPNAIISNPQSIEQNLQQVLELGLKPQQIVFELTEVEVLAQSNELSRAIAWMREEGFGIAVDDLCGCVSVDHYAMEFRPDVVKLDRRLIDGCSKYTLKQTLIESLLVSAHREGILILAEGLEDPEDIEFCRNLGVDFGQGFGLGHPEVNLQSQPFELIKFPVSKAS